MVTLRLTRCVPSCYRYLVRYYKHTLKSITASLQWNSMYMFYIQKVDKSFLFLKKRWESSLRRDLRHQVFSLLYCTTENRRMVSSQFFLWRNFILLPRPRRNLLTPLCSVSGSSSRYWSTLCSNRPVSRTMQEKKTPERNKLWDISVFQEVTKTCDCQGADKCGEGVCWW